ncbi:MAG: 2-phospho-L-lactate guanylyltransferase, partial [Methanosarcinales archaeon]
MKAVIPFKKENAKSRLSPCLSRSERETFALYMLKDVIGQINDLIAECRMQNADPKSSRHLNPQSIDAIDVLTTSIQASSFVEKINSRIKLNVILSEDSLNGALNEYLSKVKEPVLIVMADLPLINKKHISEIINSSADIVIAPGKGGGTNILFIKDPSKFQVDYYGASFLDHLKIANKYGHKVEIYDSFLVSNDIDEPSDLIELLIHGNG